MFILHTQISAVLDQHVTFRKMGLFQEEAVAPLQEQCFQTSVRVWVFFKSQIDRYKDDLPVLHIRPCLTSH